MRVVLSCGGTGGHITPALAIADILRENDANAEIMFIGARGGMEEELVGRCGYPIRTLAVRGLSRKLTLQNLHTLYMAHRAVLGAEQLLRELRPGLVIGTGGYASYPALRAAIRLGVPTAVHESNAVPGLTVRRLAGHLSRVWLNFEDAAPALRGAKTLVVGNPLPRGYAIPRAAPLPEGTRLMLLSFGGSLGARELNRAILELMERERDLTDVFHLHATGKRCYEEFMTELRSRGLEGCKHLRVVPFLTDMPQQMAAASLVICRAGAMSISELAALGRPAILVPSPNVTGDHQRKNAMALAARGAALCLEEAQISLLPERALSLLRDEGALRSLSCAVRSFHRSEANRLILRDIRALYQEQ